MYSFIHVQLFNFHASNELVSLKINCQLLMNPRKDNSGQLINLTLQLSYDWERDSLTH